MTPDLTLDNNAIKIRIRLITDIDYVTLIQAYIAISSKAKKPKATALVPKAILLVKIKNT